MPNATIAQGTPLENTIKGFDRPEYLFGVESDGRLLFFGYKDQVERYCEEKKISASEIKRIYHHLTPTPSV